MQKDKLEGIGRFSWEVCKRLIENNQNIKFTLFFDRPFSTEFTDFPNAKGVYLGPPARHPYLYIFWLELSLRRMIHKNRPDILFCPDGFLSLGVKIPQIPVIHDLAFEHFPEGISKTGVWYYKKYMRLFANKAAHILTVSEYSKQDIHQTYQIPENNITSVFNGAHAIFKPLQESEKQIIRDQYSKGLPYFMYVGSIHPRKNLNRLIQAFNQFKEQTKLPHQLVLTGRKAWNFQDVMQAYQTSNWKQDIIFTGFVDDALLSKLYASADVFCYVSIFEGFGIPILEAMQCGTPVIYANTSSMPEVAADAGIPINPENVDEIAQAMIYTLENKQEYIQKGFIQAQKFSWNRTYELTEEVLKRYL